MPLQVLTSAVLVFAAAAAARRARTAKLARRARRRIAATLEGERPHAAQASAVAEDRRIVCSRCRWPSTPPDASLSPLEDAAPPSSCTLGHGGDGSRCPRHRIDYAPTRRRALAALERARVPGGPARWWAAWRAAVPLAAAAGTVAAGPGLGLLLAAGSVAGPALALHLARGRADAAYERCIPVVLEDTARQLRSGRALAEALVRAGGSGACREEPRLAGDLEQLGRVLERGELLADAISAWARARPLPGVRLAAAALCIVAVQGGGQARAVEGVAAALRERLDRVAEIRAASAQARASVAVLGLAPLAFALVAILIDPRTAHAAISSPPGLMSISAGLTLDLVAVAWMHRLTRAA